MAPPGGQKNVTQVILPQRPKVLLDVAMRFYLWSDELIKG